MIGQRQTVNGGRPEPKIRPASPIMEVMRALGSSSRIIADLIMPIASPEEACLGLNEEPRITLVARHRQLPALQSLKKRRPLFDRKGIEREMFEVECEQLLKLA